MSAISSPSDPKNAPSPDGRQPGAPDDDAEPVATSQGREAHAPEFRPYRRFVTLTALVAIFSGSVYLLFSAGMTIYRQRHAIPSADPIGRELTPEALRSCLEELSDVNVALEKHLEKSHYLLGGYDPEEAQRWASEGDIWRNQWRVLGERCRLDRPAPAPVPPQFEEMQAAHRELGDTAQVYTRELLRFVREQAPRLDRLRVRINRIAERLAPP